MKGQLLIACQDEFCVNEGWNRRLLSGFLDNEPTEVVDQRKSVTSTLDEFCVETCISVFLNVFKLDDFSVSS